MTSPQTSYERYRAFIEKKSWTCVACITRKPGKQIADVIPGADGAVPVCYQCRPYVSDDHALQLQSFSSKTSDGQYWRIGPNPPADPSKDPPVVKDNRSKGTVEISEERLRRYENAKFRKEENKRIQASRKRI